jgi:hypothetical protein
VPAPEVFISYSRSDSSAAQALRAHLTTVGMSTFLNRYALPAGQPWQPQLEQAIARCDSMAVLLGPSGIGTWQQREIELSLDHQAEREKTNRPFPVLPILLQGMMTAMSRSVAFWASIRGSTCAAASTIRRRCNG